jgi:hypothetical protein
MFKKKKKKKGHEGKKEEQTQNTTPPSVLTRRPLQKSPKTKYYSNLREKVVLILAGRKGHTHGTSHGLSRGKRKVVAVI